MMSSSPNRSDRLDIVVNFDQTTSKQIRTAVSGYLVSMRGLDFSISGLCLTEGESSRLQLLYHLCATALLYRTISVALLSNCVKLYTLDTDL